MRRRQLLKNSATTIAGVGVLPGLSILFESCGLKNTTGYESIYLEKEDYDSVSQLTELILPRTSTPGASDAGVAAFIDLLFASYFEEPEKRQLELGLKNFLSRCREIYDTSFNLLDPDQQIEYLTTIESADQPDSFFRSIRGADPMGVFHLRSWNENDELRSGSR